MHNSSLKGLKTNFVMYCVELNVQNPEMFYICCYNFQRNIRIVRERRHNESHNKKIFIMNTTTPMIPCRFTVSSKYTFCFCRFSPRDP